MVKKLISVFLAAVFAVTGLTVSAGAEYVNYEYLWGNDLYDMLGLIRSNAEFLDVTNKNVMEDQYLNRMKASGSLTVFSPYKFTLKKKDTISVEVETSKDFITSGLCAFIYNEDLEMYYDFTDFYFTRSSKFGKTSFSFEVENLPKGKYYMVLTGTSDTKGKLKFEFTAEKSLEDKPKVTATALGDGKVKLKWKKIKGATKYRISKLVSGKYKTIKKSTKKTSYTVTGLTKRNSYKFAVQAYVNGNWTTLSLTDAVEIKAQ